MKINYFHPAKHFLFSRRIFFFSTIVLVLTSGALIGYDIQFFIYVIGFISIIGYIILCFKRPFWAFVGLILLGLTVWLSRIQLLYGISLMVGTGGVFFVIWLVRLSLHNASFITMKKSWYLAGLAATIVLSTVINWGGPAGIVPVFTFIQLMLLTVLVINYVTTPTRLHQLGYVFIASSVLLAIAILLNQWGILPNGSIRIMQSGVYSSAGFDRFERSGGIFGDPNFSALQLTIALPFIMEYWSKSLPSRKAWLVVAGVGILWAFLYTVSMGGLIGIASMLLVKVLLVRQSNFLVKLVRVISMGMIALWLNFRFMPSYYLERIKISLAQLTQYFQTFDQTLFLQLGTFRGDTWQSAVRTFLQSPIIGHGPGNSLFLNPSNSILSYLRPELAAHNFILSIAGDLGLIGLFFFISLLISALWAVRPYGATKTLKNSLQITRNAIFTGLLACVVQGMALDLHTQKALWILIGMAFAYKRYSSLPVIDHEKVL